MSTDKNPFELLLTHPLRVNFPVFAHKKVRNVDFRVIVPLDFIPNFDPSISIVVRTA